MMTSYGAMRPAAFALVKRSSSMMPTPLRLHERPVDADYSIALEPLQGFCEGQKTRASFLMESHFTKVGPALGRPHCHDAIICQKRLEMPVRFWFLPKGV